jgi:hypothetical protein
MNHTTIAHEESPSYPIHMNGVASPSQPDDGDDIAAQLRAAVKEATGIEIAPPIKSRMGFLP